MGTLNHPFAKDLGDGCTHLLLEVEKTDRLPFRKRKVEPRGFFISREKNLSLSFLLLLVCYAALLFPAFWISAESTRKNERTSEGIMALLNQSAALLSQDCRQGWIGSRLRTTPMQPALPKIPVFLENGSEVWRLPPPLGLQGSEEVAARTLWTLPDNGLPALLGSKACKRCVVVGSGGVLYGSQLGAHIDQYDIVIRMNNAPVFGFERDAGSRTTIRMMYPEGAPDSSREYEGTVIVALVVFKSLDLKWLTSVITGKPLNWWSKLWFWRNVVEYVPLKPENFRILNPEIMHQTGLQLQLYAKTQKKTVPTLGASAVMVALQLCDTVSLAGFGYDLQHPRTALHYYESLHTDAMQAQLVHDVSAETRFLRELVRKEAVCDLTGALQGAP
ncbi:ST3 beta-galactoside alpha-2,3-sialyltransferase 7 isoform X1 [Paramormyrops kingsleyae]|uniref:ST3 beta-galactoside alpha-2,3-sialyltransferase 7 isoform X1 n=1 Tax=Paramormyrops kingsleyae TaxID=1676925 RepID=UPI003B96D1EF